MKNTLTLLILFCAWAPLSAAATDAIIKEHLPQDPASFVEGKNGWRFLPAELSHALAGNPADDAKQPFEAIVDTRKQLAALGIRLILVPVPTKLAVHADKLDERLTAPLPHNEAFLDALRKEGIETLDLTADFAASKTPAYCLRDSHWNGVGIKLAAQSIAKQIGQAPPAKQPFKERAETIEIQGDLGGEKEKVALSIVEAAGDLPIESKTSPILLLGDSHALVFHEGGDMHAVGGGLPGQLAWALGEPIDVLAVRGSGATAVRISLARRARSTAGWLEAKKVVVWCLAARELTQADSWKAVPLLKEGGVGK